MIGVRVGDSAAATETNATEYSFIGYNNKNVYTSGELWYLDIEGSEYGLIPTPQTTGLPIFLKYYRIPAALTAVTDEPPFPENYHELVIFFALKKYWEVSDDFQKVLFYDTEFENTIERMKNDLKVQATGDLGRMKDVRELRTEDQPQKINIVELGR